MPPSGLPPRSFSDGGDVSCLGCSSSDQGQRDTVKHSGTGAAQAPGKNILSLRDSFSFHLAPNKSRAAGLELRRGKTNPAQEFLSRLGRLFQMTDRDVRMDECGWGYAKTTRRARRQGVWPSSVQGLAARSHRGC